MDEGAESRGSRFRGACRARREEEEVARDGGGSGGRR